MYFSDYGAGASGSANTLHNSYAFGSMLADAALQRVPAIIDGGDNVTYVIGGSETYTLHRNVTLQSDGARLEFSGTTTIEARHPTGAVTTTLAADVAAFSSSFTVADASGASVGGLVTLYANTAVVDGSYAGYDKWEVAVITAIDGNTITIDHSLWFFFTQSEGTVVTFRPRRSFTATNLKIGISTGGLFRLRGARGGSWTGGAITGLGTYSVEDPAKENPLQISQCAEITFSLGADISDANIGVTVTAGSADIVFDGVGGTGTLHPIDAQVWARNTIIRNCDFTGNGNAIVSHPSINTRFEDCTSVETAGLYRNRSIGGGFWRGSIERASGVPYTTADGGGFTIVPLNADYLYLNAAGLSEHVLEDLTSETLVLQLAQGAVGRMTRVTAPALVNNGNNYGAKTLYLTSCTFGAESISNTTVVRV